jgi:hypothetical protein
MVFITKKLISDKTIEVTQLNDNFYAKINYQPFDKYIVVCKIKFNTIDDETISDITIYNPTGKKPDIINEFNFFDKDGNDTLSNGLKENLYRSIFYSQYESSEVPYFMNIGFSFDYYYTD